jgi:hypothetical protein
VAAAAALVALGMRQKCLPACLPAARALAHKRSSCCWCDHGCSRMRHQGPAIARQHAPGPRWRCTRCP